MGESLGRPTGVQRALSRGSGRVAVGLPGFLGIAIFVSGRSAHAARIIRQSPLNAGHRLCYAEHRAFNLVRAALSLSVLKLSVTASP